MFEKIEDFFKERYFNWDGACQFDGTGDRLRRLVEEMCWPMEQIQEEVDRCFKKDFPESVSEMVILTPTVVWTLCPHHILPCRFEVCIGYIPSGQSVLGLSKFSRIAVLMGKRPIMQETYTREVADIIENKIKPEGLGVWVIGSHGCMEVRGILQSAKVSTSVLRGSFMDDQKVREEFYSIARSLKESK